MAGTSIEQCWDRLREEVEAMVANYQKIVTQLEAKISKLESKVQKLKDKVARLDAELKAATQLIADLKAQIARAGVRGDLLAEHFPELTDEYKLAIKSLKPFGMDFGMCTIVAPAS